MHFALKKTKKQREPTIISHAAESFPFGRHDGRNSSTRRIRLRIYSQSSRLSTTGLSSNERLILAGVNVAGDVAVTRIEWITRARNDASVADDWVLLPTPDSRRRRGGSATGSRTLELNSISRGNRADEPRTK